VLQITLLGAQARDALSAMVPTEEPVTEPTA
jgi:hypothetical protein